MLKIGILVLGHSSSPFLAFFSLFQNANGDVGAVIQNEVAMDIDRFLKELEKLYEAKELTAEGDVSERLRCWFNQYSSAPLHSISAKMAILRS